MYASWLYIVINILAVYDFIQPISLLRFWISEGLTQAYVQSTY